MSLLIKKVYLIKNSFESLQQIRNYAARKGTRARKESKKVKTETEKVGFIPHNLRDKEKLAMSRPSRKFDDSWRRVAVDNVYVSSYFRSKAYPFLEAVQCHKETHHPDMYNIPNAKLYVNIELNMQGAKATRFVDNFTRIAPMPYKFDHGEERPIIAFCKNEDLQKEVMNVGAQLAGGVELIKEVQNGSVSLKDFQLTVAHPDILPELVPLRGLLKRKFPSVHNGALDTNLTLIVERFLNGLSYKAVKDEYEKDFGIIETFIGTLDMESEHLEENFKSLIQDINKMRPKREGDFIKRCLLISPPSGEKLKVDYSVYIDEVEKEDSDDEVDKEVAII